MQSQPGSQRGFQRRSPGAEPGPPPNVPVRSISPGTQGRPQQGSVSRSSQSSSRRVNRENSGSGSNMPLSQIEKSVTHLLVATKQLLETLTQWSRGQATDTQVSDVYVRLGYEFNMACRAFSAINVDVSDLGNVPDSLRHILEATLSQEASSENLENYLPRIRDIIINLLHGLKRKQHKLRQKQFRDRDGNPIPERTTSVSTVGSGNSGLTNLLEEGIENGYKPDAPRSDSLAAQRNPSPTRRFPSQREQSLNSISSEQSTLSSNTMQNIPVLPPYPGDESMPSLPSAGKSEVHVDSFPPPPPPPPDNQSSALAALQKGGDLERRASRRYSQYQISKHLGGSVNGVPILAQNGPVPNRGKKEARESLRAVQKRESVRHSRHTSTQSRAAAQDTAPARVPSRVSEEAAQGEESTSVSESPEVQTPEDKYAPSATLAGPLPDAPEFVSRQDSLPDANATATTPKADEPPKIEEKSLPPPPRESKPSESYFQVSPPPTPTQDLTLFLQYKSKVKKFVLPEGREELTIGRLQLAFIEKFSWSTQQNGTDLPEIYIQDPVSGVRHELEDLTDVKDRTVLVLNVEPLDEIKRHIDEGMSSLAKIVQEVKQNVDDQGATLQQVSDRQQETSKELANLATNPPVTASSPGPSRPAFGSGRKLNHGQAGELQSLRRDLAVLRQTYSNFQSDVQTSMSSLRQKAADVKTVAAKAVVPDIDGDAGYSYVKEGRQHLNTDSDHLVGKVDDLQDLVEDLRKDVVHRGVRPLPRQLENVSKDISGLTKELKRMEDYLTQEKPIWTKIWEKELEDVCQGRDELRVMEELLVDLRDDLEKATETFVLVEQATKEQMKDAGTGASAGTARQFSKGLENLGNSLDPNAAKEGVLGEVRALQPNHENRLEAIERAEKLRQKELAGRRGNKLHQEIHAFVQEGRLKKSGGFEEIERARQIKEDKIRREVWDRMNGLLPEEGEEFEEGEYEEYEEEDELEGGQEREEEHEQGQDRASGEQTARPASGDSGNGKDETTTAKQDG
ncbi:Bud site selection protein-like protein [Emericellopsis cladophorae]|uniref:Bud site selection protein-like protein n=1 Tax=Emericellopsis cladophorae TaxID=2686198 RepID=A0A9Q0BEF0_9HYPO|nr:Bud site selection protein-like protein [Emericellopsis cladophorae]KAI6781535.1 Bud site selection protein-like protein [Emericellopsis cladophorae]